nr:glycine cleavage system aminomethyltransferase GcvT [Spiractinospora alimapuensis]
MKEPRRTPLYEVHQNLGATLVDFAGWQMPVRYARESEEHLAVRHQAGLFDLSHMGEIRVTGRQAGDALDYALVGAMSTLRPGRARYSMITDAEGGVLDDLITYRLGEDEYLVVANAANTDVVVDALLERASGFDAQVIDDSADYALLAVQGPNAVTILAGLTDTPLDEIKYFAGYTATVAGHDVLLARTGYTGEDGFELFLREPERAPALWEALTDAGRDHGLLPAGLSARDTLRLEAGMPLYGHELSRDVTPYEAGLGRVVNLEKPADFVGRSALRARAEAGPRSRLVGLVGRGRRVPRQGYAVLHEGARVGTITSGAPSPTVGRPIAMAYLDTEIDAGGELAVDVRGRPEPADAVELPFYRRQR